MDRTSRLMVLGRQRVRVLECMGGNDRFAPGYFEPSADADIFDAFRAYVAEISQQWAADPSPLAVPLLAAARLLTGDVTAADVIVDRLPAKPYQLDHGAGRCWVTPQIALAAALPLPAELTDTDRWLAGSADQAALRAWLARHRDKLRWVEAHGVYLPRATEPPAQLAPLPADATARVRHLMTSDQAIWHGTSDLIMVDGVPTAVIKWNVPPEGTPLPHVSLDPKFLHKIEWEDAEYVYEHPIEYPRQSDYRPSIWQRLFS